MMVPPDVQMLDVLHGDRFRRLTPRRSATEHRGETPRATDVPRRARPRRSN